MKAAFDALIKEKVSPIFKEAGFRKKGLNYVRSIGEVQQIVNFQKSGGNSAASVKFYVNIGILVDALTPEQTRELKAEHEADIRCRIQDISSRYQTDGIHINSSTDLPALTIQLSEALSLETLPFLNTVSTTEAAVAYMVEHNGLLKSQELIAYLVTHNQKAGLISYVKNVYQLFVDDGDEGRGQFFMLKFKKQIEKSGFLDAEIESALRSKS